VHERAAVAPGCHPPFQVPFLHQFESGVVRTKTMERKQWAIFVRWNEWYEAGTVESGSHPGERRD